MEKYIVVLAVFVSAVCFAAKPTGTLPIVYVNTENSRAIEDTETQIKATIYIDSVSSQYPSLGSAEAPIAATIKGRGNWTWKGFDKKPYKIKFNVKQKVLGMPNNRHWCLMANTDDYLGLLKMPAGFYVSKALGLRWTPRMRPVELVLNGQYWGLYFLTEHVRIASNRVHIHEQADNETHPDSITGGWLVEIDNYWSEGNIEFSEGNGQWVMVSLREPEKLSSEQRTYIESELYGLNEALYDFDSNLEERLDMEEAAKYYLVQEIMDDCESYHGSCFLYKDRDSLGVADKWKFGPVWDFGNAYNMHVYQGAERFIYDGPEFAQYWIGQLAQWPAFQDALSRQWYLYYHDYNAKVRDKIETLAATISQATVRDAEVWDGSQGYNNNSDMADRLSAFLAQYDWRINWLYQQWGEGAKPEVTGIEEERLEWQGRKVLRNGQLLIIRGGKTYTLQGQQTH